MNCAPSDCTVMRAKIEGLDKQLAAARAQCRAALPALQGLQQQVGTVRSREGLRRQAGRAGQGAGYGQVYGQV
jgi:hypothetical protein